MATFDPLATSMAACTSVYGGHTTISSRSCPATSGRKSRKYASVSSGVLFIFQLPASIFFLIDVPFRCEMEKWDCYEESFRRRARTRSRWLRRKEQIAPYLQMSPTTSPPSWRKPQPPPRPLLDIRKPRLKLPGTIKIASLPHPRCEAVHEENSPGSRARYAQRC